MTLALPLRTPALQPPHRAGAPASARPPRSGGLLRCAATLAWAAATLLPLPPTASAATAAEAPATASAAGIEKATGALTPEQAAQDARVLTQALLALHPALTKYRTRAEIDQALAHFNTRAQAARHAPEMLLAAAELAAAIRCGHTWVNPRNQGAAVQAWLLQGADKLPYTAALVQQRWLVLASADAAIAAGDEVLAVNGVAAGDMVRRLWPYLRADGHSDTKRLRQLGHDRFDASALDTTWPLLSPPVDGHWQLDLRSADGTRRQARVAATTLAARRAALAAQGVATLSADWSLRIEGDVATLRLPSFAFWNKRFDGSRFLDESFAEIAQRRVPHLLIDIRDNEGGDTALGHRILSHLIRAPITLPAGPSVSAYERVPYALARYLDTWNFDFFDRTGQVEQAHRGHRRRPVPLDRSRPQPQRRADTAAPGPAVHRAHGAAGGRRKQLGGLPVCAAGAAGPGRAPGGRAHRRQPAGPEQRAAGLGAAAELRRGGGHPAAGHSLQRRHARRPRDARHRGGARLRRAPRRARPGARGGAARVARQALSGPVQDAAACAAAYGRSRLTSGRPALLR
jgi:hypothetical protein